MSMLGGIRTHMESKGYGWAFDVEDDDDDGEEKRPLMEELEIDPTDIILKAKCVFMPPRDGLGLIQDFWGPLSIVLLYASLLVWGQMAVVSWILSLWLGGSCIIFFLVRVLGADMTLSHTVGTLGYNLLPLVFSRVAMLAIGQKGPVSVLVRLVCTAWATFSASRWLLTSDLARKRMLLVYPIALHYFFFVALSTGV